MNDNSMAGGHFCCCWMISNGSHTWDASRDNDEGLLCIIEERGGNVSRFKIWDSANLDANDWGDAGASSTRYYMQFVRSGTTMIGYIYLDAAHTNLHDTLTIICTTDTYRYVHGWANRGDSIGNNVTIDTWNLDLQEAAGGGLTLTLNPSPKGGTGRPPLLTGGASFGG